MKHVNIPLFIPHLGCPNQCVFCNQRLISGTLSFCESDVDAIIGEILSSCGADTECEIAFFGGSFTGIDRDLMIRLLDLAQGYVDRGDIAGIRMSTRPDYIDDEILRILKRYTVSEVELGLQSFTDGVLVKAKRGHTSERSVMACKMLKDYGFSFVGQMMIGLPGAKIEDEIYCAEMICSLGAAAARIYPAVVFKGTELESMLCSGEYTALSEDEAVYRSKEVLKVFDRFGVPCIRVGLCESENLHSEDTYAAGPNHGAIGELARSELFFDKICDKLDLYGDIAGREIVIYSARGTISQVIGQKKRNKIKILSKYNIKKIKSVEMDMLTGYNIIIKVN